MTGFFGDIDVKYSAVSTEDVVKNKPVLLLVIFFICCFGFSAQSSEVAYSSFDIWSNVFSFKDVKAVREKNLLFLKFDGKNSFVKFNIKKFNPFPEEGFTYSFCVKPFSTGSGRHASIVSCHNHSGNYWNGISLVDDKIEFVLQNAETSDTYYWYCETPVIVNEWQHITISYNNLGIQQRSVVFYINDKPAGMKCSRSAVSKEFSRDFIPGYNPFDPLGLVIGRLNEDIPNAYFHGEISGLYFFDYPLNLSKFESLNISY